MRQLDFEDLLAIETYLTVAKLTRDIKVILEGTFPNVWVQGEVSNFRHHTSGHMYFSLKDEQAQISCVIWRSNNQNLPFIPEDGLKVLVKARLSLYEKRGNYQLDIWQIQPAGAGQLQLAFEQLKRKLHGEGLFAEEHKKLLPRFPERIGIITSPTGAALRDFITVLRRRFPSAELILRPVRVQGDGAAQEIARALDEFNEFDAIDIIVLTRGGGSLEDLWPFNEEIVARAIFRSHIPVVSAVGHEIDFSISDFVADLRAPTPSAAAEMVVRSQDEIKNQLNSFVSTMNNALMERTRYMRERLYAIRKSYAFGRPLDLIRQNLQRIDELHRQLQQMSLHQVAISGEKLDGLKKRLNLLEHHNVLKRGYAMCYRNGESLVTEAQQLTAEDKIKIEFSRGNVNATVQQVNPN